MLIGKQGKESKTAYINVQNEYGNTPLLYSTHLKQTNAVKYLLHHGANPNIQNNEGFTPLFISFLVLYDEIGNVIYKPDPFIIKFLLDAGADPNLVTKNRLTILEEIKNKVDNDANIPSNIKEILEQIENQNTETSSNTEKTGGRNKSKRNKKRSKTQQKSKKQKKSKTQQKSKNKR